MFRVGADDGVLVEHVVVVVPGPGALSPSAARRRGCARASAGQSCSSKSAWSGSKSSARGAASSGGDQPAMKPRPPGAPRCRTGRRSAACRAARPGIEHEDAALARLDRQLRPASAASRPPAGPAALTSMPQAMRRPSRAARRDATSLRDDGGDLAGDERRALGARRARRAASSVWARTSLRREARAPGAIRRRSSQGTRRERAGSSRAMAAPSAIWTRWFSQRRRAPSVARIR